jgi:hypothetical protein
MTPRPIRDLGNLLWPIGKAGHEHEPDPQVHLVLTRRAQKSRTTLRRPPPLTF